MCLLQEFALLVVCRTLLQSLLNRKQKGSNIWSSSPLPHGTSVKKSDLDVAFNTHYFPEIITRLSFMRFARISARKYPDHPNTHFSGKISETDISAIPFCCQRKTPLWLPWLLLWILHFHLQGLQSLHTPLQMLHFLTICVSWVCPEGKLAGIQFLLEKEECYKTAIVVTCSYLRMSWNPIKIQMKLVLFVSSGILKGSSGESWMFWKLLVQGIPLRCCCPENTFALWTYRIA